MAQAENDREEASALNVVTMNAFRWPLVISSGVAGLLLSACGKEIEVRSVALNSSAGVEAATRACEELHQDRTVCISAAREFEREVVASARSLKDCNAVVLWTKPHEEPPSGGLLSIGFVPGRADQPWTLRGVDGAHLLRGQGTPDAVAREVCTSIESWRAAM